MNTTVEANQSGDGDIGEVTREVLDLKEQIGDELLILTHHYQRPEIVRVGDVKGDSFELAREASRREGVEHIVFCGVLFMAEAAAVVARPDQRVYHPNPRAGCPLADFADAVQVSRALERIAEVRGPDQVMPITYMNSDVQVKAVVGAAGGTVCTSSNADKAFTWALGQRPSVIFVPDQHLGRNTADSLDISPDEIMIWDPWIDPSAQDEESIMRARAFLWRGHCHVHTWFRPNHIEEARQSHPDGLVYVHPECPREVVGLADGSGSTKYLVQKASEAPAGSTITIGTEINLVVRLAQDHPDKTILPLGHSLCPNMYRITMRKLRNALVNLQDAPRVSVDDDVRESAKLALERMLTIAG